MRILAKLEMSVVYEVPDDEDFDPEETLLTMTDRTYEKGWLVPEQSLAQITLMTVRVTTEKMP